MKDQAVNLLVTFCKYELELFEWIYIIVMMLKAC